MPSSVPIDWPPQSGSEGSGVAALSGQPHPSSQGYDQGSSGPASCCSSSSPARTCAVAGVGGPPPPPPPALASRGQQQQCQTLPPSSSSSFTSLPLHDYNVYQNGIGNAAVTAATTAARMRNVVNGTGLTCHALSMWIANVCYRIA